MASLVTPTMSRGQATGFFVGAGCFFYGLHEALGPGWALIAFGVALMLFVVLYNAGRERQREEGPRR